MAEKAPEKAPESDLEIIGDRTGAGLVVGIATAIAGTVVFGLPFALLKAAGLGSIGGFAKGAYDVARRKMKQRATKKAEPQGGSGNA